jgi:hypothetical protein
MKFNTIAGPAVPLGKGEVDSSILSGSTIKPQHLQHLIKGTLPCPPPIGGEQDVNSPAHLGENAGNAFGHRSPLAHYEALRRENSRADDLALLHRLVSENPHADDLALLRALEKEWPKSRPAAFMAREWAKGGTQ